jgi:hypothetical protein
VVEHGQQFVQHAYAVGVALAVGACGFFAPTGCFQYCQDGGVFPDPAQADFAAEPLVDGRVVLLLRCDRPAGVGQGIYQQRSGGGCVASELRWRTVGAGL